MCFIQLYYFIKYLGATYVLGITIAHRNKKNRIDVYTSRYLYKFV
jgi:hypothetical protein